MKRLNPIIMLLSLFILPVQAYSQDLNPKVKDFLNHLNQFYYCGSHEGLSGFKCDVTATLSGNLPGLMLPGQYSPNYLFHLSYLGAGLETVMTSAMGEPDSPQTAKKVKLIGTVSDGFIKIWGGLTLNPLFATESAKADYRVDQNEAHGFAVTGGKPGKSISLIFDKAALAHKAIINAVNQTIEMDLGYEPTPKGFMLKKLGFGAGEGQNQITFNVQMDYQTIQGFQLPSNFTLTATGPKGQFQITYQFSNYHILGRAGGQTGLTENDTRIVPSQSEEPGSKHFLWRVQSSTATVYLLGSIHVRPDEPLQVPEIIEQCFNSSNYVGFEIDLSKMDEIKKEILAYYKEHDLYPADDNLKNHLTPAEWEKVKGLLSRYGMAEETAIRCKPVLLAEALDELMLTNQDYVGRQGIDEIFYRKAQAVHKPVFAMEYWMEQVQPVEELTEREQIQYLFLSVKEGYENEDIVKKAIGLWEAGDDKGIASLENTEREPLELALNEKMIKGRNAKWMFQMDRMLKTNATYFVVVGSAHLVGPNGLPNLLKSKGYNVDQL